MGQYGEALTTPGYCWYNNDIANKSTYGALYNWFVVDAASSGGKNVCPTGWHVPSDEEWTILTTYLGGEGVAGGKLKEAGTTHWLSPNDATNESGFTARPGGDRSGSGTYSNIGSNGGWWSSFEISATRAYTRYMLYFDSYVSRTNYYKPYGFSVRCLRD